jgi:hypothetical protein
MVTKGGSAPTPGSVLQLLSARLASAGARGIDVRSAMLSDSLGIDSLMARDSSVAAGTISARSETARARPAFRDALKSRRCLIPADRFYE